MLPLADTHVHLLAGLDDGPQSDDEALAMARMLVAEGARYATALAHQNPFYPANDAAGLCEAARRFAEQLAERSIPLSVVPTGEVMLTPETLTDWQAGRLLSVGDHKKFLLVEMPHTTFLDVRPLAANLAPQGVRLIIAHAERYPELLHDAGATERLIAAGCLIQVTTSELADPPNAANERALKDWAQRGIIHVLGSDGHGLGRREPRLQAGVAKLARWAGAAAADRIGGIWGTAVLRGGTLTIPPPIPKPRSWFGRLFGS